MVRLTSPEKNSTLLGSSSGPLELRVTNAPLAGQIVQLHGSKCTIGSGRRCTLRLQARRVEPVHCLILRGENGTVIRRWSTNTRLNGAAFTDALLKPGDRLTIGPIVLEVLATGRAMEETQRGVQQLLSETVQSSLPTQSSPTQPSPVSTKEAEEIAAQRAELAQREETLATQEKELLAERSAWEADRKVRQADLDHLKHELGNAQQFQLDLPVLMENQQRVEAELAEKQEQLETEKEQLRLAQADLQSDREIQENAFAKRRRELDEESDALHLTREKLSAEQANFEAQQQAAAEAFEQRDAELNQRQLELDAALKQSAGQAESFESDLQQREADWQAAQAAWASERSVWETTCQETSDELLRQEQELRQQQAALEAQRTEWERERSLAQEDLIPEQQALQELNQALQEKQERLDAQQKQWETQHADQLAQLEKQKTELAAQEKALQEQQEAFEAQAKSEQERTPAADTEQNQSSFSAESETAKSDSFSGAEEELCDSPAFEPAADVSDTLRSITKVETISESADEATVRSGLDSIELTEDPTELEPAEELAAPEENVFVEPETETETETEAEAEAEASDSTELPEEAEATDQPISLAERLFGIADAEPDAQIVEDETEEPLNEAFRSYEPASHQDETEEPLESTTQVDEPSVASSGEEPEFSLPSKASPAESSGLMERLRAMADWDEDEQGADSARSGYDAAVPLPSQPVAGTEPSFQHGSKPDNAAEDEDEESIEDYMAKMMVRIRGKESHDAAVKQGSHSTPKKHSIPTQNKPVQSPTPSLEPEPETKSTEPQKPFEMSPRKTPVELTSNLAAMRELANSSAREAIDISVRARWSQAALGKFSVAILALVAAGFLFMWTTDPMSITFLGGGVALLVAVFWGLQGMVILKGVWKANHQSALPNAQEEESVLLQQRIFAENNEAQAEATLPTESVSELEVEGVSDPTEQVGTEASEALDSEKTQEG